MAKYTCGTCGIEVENSWEVCEPAAEKSAPVSLNTVNQASGSYVCGSCGVQADSPDSLCQPQKA